MNPLRRILAVLALTLAIAGVAGRTASEFFVAAPDRIIRLLPQSTRMDMLDYYRFGSDRPSINRFGGPAILRGEHDAVVEFEVDKDVEMQLAVIPAGKSDTIVALITTCKLPAADSSIEFFDPSWRPLTKGMPAVPAYAVWLTGEGAAKADEINVRLPFIPCSAAFNDDATVLTFTNEAGHYLDSEVAEKLMPLLVPSIVYDIVDGHFKLRK